MSEQKQQTIDEKVEKIKKSLENLNSKNFRIFIFSPSVGGPSGGIGVLYQHAKVLKELNYNVSILTEKKDYKYPEWLGDKYSGIEHVSLEATKLQVSPEDFLILPEGYAGVLGIQTKSLACRRIILCQSWVYVLGNLMPGQKWSDESTGIRNTIVVCDPLKKYIETIFGEHDQNIKVCRQYIDEDIFHISEKPQKPIIAISSRDQMQSLNIIKHFYLRYPQYRWISFKDMKGLSREEFAETLRESCLGVFLDKVSGFGTFPIECAKSGVPVIALIPDITPEYATENSCIWTGELLSIPDLISNFIKLYLEDAIPEEITKGTKELSKKYGEKEGIQEIERTYRKLVDERKEEFQTFINSNREISQQMLEKKSHEIIEENS